MLRLVRELSSKSCLADTFTSAIAITYCAKSVGGCRPLLIFACTIVHFFLSRFSVQESVRVHFGGFLYSGLTVAYI